MTDRTVADILQDLRQSQQGILELLDGLEENQIHQPVNDEWTVSTVFAHLSEAREFYAQEVQNVLASPGRKMGRTIEYERRKQAINTSHEATLEKLRQDLGSSHQSVMTSLMKMTDDDLQLEGEHVVTGPETLLYFIDHFLVEHDQVHLEQATTFLGELG